MLAYQVNNRRARVESGLGQYFRKLGKAWRWIEHLDDSHSICTVDPNTEVLDKISEASDTELYVSPANAWNYACKICLKDIWRSVTGTRHARLLLLQSQDEDGSEAMNRPCHICLCQLDCLALACGLTLAVEVAARKHDVVLYKISRWLTYSKGSSRRISRHNWWPSWCQCHSSSLLRADRIHEIWQLHQVAVRGGVVRLVWTACAAQHSMKFDFDEPKIAMQLVWAM